MYLLLWAEFAEKHTDVDHERTFLNAYGIRYIAQDGKPTWANDIAIAAPCVRELVCKKRHLMIAADEIRARNWRPPPQK